jgi:ribosome-binding factor A
MSRKFTSSGPSQRQLRVGELLRHALAEILARGDVRDPALQGVSVTVTEVRPSPDLKNATVFCAPLGGRHEDEVIEGLNRCRAYLRGQVGHAVSLKFTPQLNFLCDRSFDEAKHIDDLLRSKEVARDLGGPESKESEIE